jgi:putative peptidoglycan lipid II flippase
LNKENKNTSSILNSIKKVSGWTSISRVFGLIRDVATTGLLGASYLHDIFVVILKIPNLFRRFFAEGAFNQAFIPVYSEYFNKNDAQSSKAFLDSLFGTLLTFLFLFVVFVLLFSPIVVFIFAPGFYSDPQKQILSVEILRIMFPYLALISLVAFASAIQNTHSKFSIPAATPIIFNLCLIITAYTIAPSYQIPVYPLAWSVLVAGILQLLMQIAPLAAIDRIPIPRLNFSHPGVRKVLLVMLPAIFAGGIMQINILVDTIFASLLETGSPTWLYISDRLIQLPMGIFAIAIGTVLLPLLSKIDFKNNKIEFIDNVRKGQRLVLLIGLPSCIGIFFCSEAIIAAIFYRGEFTYIDVIKTSLSLKVLALGLPFFMLMKILRKLTSAPVLVAAISLILNIFLNYVFAFIYGYGHIGIAIGSAIAALISVLILEFILIKDGVVKLVNPLNRFNLTLLLSCLVLSAYLIWFNQYFSFQEMNAMHRIMILSAEVISAILLYFICIKIFLGNKLRQLIS